MFTSHINNSRRVAAKLPKEGFSLVELLVAMLVTTIVTGVAFSVYRATSSHYFREDAYIQQQQNLRAATYLLARDIRASGNGLAVVGPGVERIQAYVPSYLTSTGGAPVFNATDGWFRHPDSPADELGFMSIFGTDGGESHSDTLTLFKTEIEYPVALGQITGISGNTLKLSKELRDGTLNSGDILIVVQNTEAFLLEAKTDDKNTPNNEVDFENVQGRFTHTNGPPAGFDWDYAQLYNLRDISLVTYYVDETEHRLMAAIHDQRNVSYDSPATRSVIMANNIEDLQIYYFFQGDDVDTTKVTLDPAVGYNEFKQKNVIAIAIGITSRSGYGDGIPTKIRPALFNRPAGITTDTRRRSTLMELVTIRNTIQ
jgi:prepilin-type N-terminal cleavage/methylation domain-containing protein